MKKHPKLFYNKLKHGMRYNTYKSIKHTQKYSLTGTLMEIIKPFLNNGSMSSERRKISDTRSMTIHYYFVWGSTKGQQTLILKEPYKTSSLNK